MSLGDINQSASTGSANADNLPAVINVVALHSEENVTAEIWDAYQHIRRALRNVAELKIHPVQLDWLHYPTLQAEAGRAVAGANVIVVRAGDPGIASPDFRRWAERWPAATNLFPRVLVIFPVPGWQMNSPDRNGAWLCDLAWRKNMDILARDLWVGRWGVVRHPQWNEPGISALPVNFEPLPPDLMGLGQPEIESFRDYGMNND
jgi:hypothetical protein